jgi:hypothetical protein
VRTLCAQQNASLSLGRSKGCNSLHSPLVTYSLRPIESVVGKACPPHKYVSRATLSTGRREYLPRQPQFVNPVMIIALHCTERARQEDSRPIQYLQPSSPSWRSVVAHLSSFIQSVTFFLMYELFKASRLLQSSLVLSAGRHEYGVEESAKCQACPDDGKLPSKRRTIQIGN